MLDVVERPEARAERGGNRAAHEARAAEWATPELIGHVERYAAWAAFREWGEGDSLLSLALETAWRSLIYAAEKEAEGVYSFDTAAGVRPWVMSSVGRRLRWYRDRRKPRRKEKLGRLDDLGRFAVAADERPGVEDLDRAEFWGRVEAALVPTQLEAVRSVFLDGLLQRDLAERRGTTRASVGLQINKGLAHLRGPLEEFAD